MGRMIELPGMNEADILLGLYDEFFNREEYFVYVGHPKGMTFFFDAGSADRDVPK
jgi:hypothetical protein